MRVSPISHVALKRQNKVGVSLPLAGLFRLSTALYFFCEGHTSDGQPQEGMDEGRCSLLDCFPLILELFSYAHIAHVHTNH